MSRHRTDSCETASRLVALVGLLLALGSASRASAAEESLAVLGVEAVEVSDAVGTQLTEALRRKAAETQGVRLVPGKDLIELKMVFGCDGEAPACLAQAGRTLGADRLLYGTLKKADGGKSVQVSLKLLDVRDLAVVKQITETVPRKTFTGPVLSAAASRWFGQLVVPPQSGTIAVQSQPVDAQVLVDGQVAGKTPLKLKDIKPGSHSVALQLEGYQGTTQTVEVSAGAIASLFIKLEREVRPEPVRPPAVGVVEPPPVSTGATLAEPSRPRHPGRPAKIAAIGLIAGAVVSGAVAIYTWRSYLKLENSARSDLEQIMPTGGAITQDQRDFFGTPRCTTPPVAPSPVRDSYVNNCDSGNKFADATTGLWISAGVLATAGIVSFIVGERLDAKADKERRNKGIQQSLRLLPAISTQGGGLQASFEF